MKYFLVRFIHKKIIDSCIFTIKFFTRVKKNRITLHQPFKFGYDCNQKYISEEILKQELPYEIIWITRDKKLVKESPISKIKFVLESNVLEYLYYVLTSKICITNARWALHEFPIKRKGQIFMNTWHGSLGIKKVGGSKNSKKISKNEPSNILKLTDYFISNSTFETDVYRNSINFKNEILEFGHPRNDILIDGVLTQAEKENINKQVRQYNNNNIPNDTKLVLYAPTFRNNSNIKCFDMDYQLLIKTLEQKFGNKFVLLLRLHPTIRNLYKNFTVSTHNIFDYTNYTDIQELMLAADIMITDYSSCIFDYILTRKAGFIYASDIEEYDQARGFYYPLESTPFPVIKNNNELKEKILKFDNTNYKKEVEKFLDSKSCIEDGMASKRVVEFIKKQLNEVK